MALPSLRSAPALRAALLMGSGIVLARHFENTPDPHWLFVGAALIVLASLTLALPIIHPGICSAALALAIIATGLATFYTTRSIRSEQPHVPTDRKSQVIGIVDEEPVIRQGSVRFLLKVSAIRGDGEFLPARMLAMVTVRRPPEDSLASTLRLGARILAYGLVDTPAGARNPGEFDSRNYLAVLGVTRELFVESPRELTLIEPPNDASVQERLLSSVRGLIVTTIDSSVSGPEGEFLKGLLLGQKKGLTPETREAFVVAGVAHVLAVSGSNVAVVAGVVLSICLIFRVRPYPRAITVSLALLSYMLLTGSQPPVVRATITAIVLILATWRQEKANPLNGIGLSAILLVAIDPFTLLDVGFQLSYSAVLAILLIDPLVNRWIESIPWIGSIHRTSRWRRSCRAILRLAGVSLAATVGTLPFTAAYFGQVSLIGIAANMVVVPATGLSVALGLAMTLAAPVSNAIASAFGSLNWLVLRFTLAVTEHAASVPGAAIIVGGFETGDALIYCAVLGAVVSLLIRRYCRVLVPVCLVVLHVPLFQAGGVFDEGSRGRLTFAMLDVGQGDALLIETPEGKNILIDAGPASYAFDSGEQILVPYLRTRMIDTLHLVVVTHSHRDHTGGLRAVLRRAVPGRIVAAPGFSLEGLSVDRAAAGMEISPDPSVRLYVLAPQVHPASPRVGPNSESVVMLLRAGSRAFLLTGDCEGAAEQEIVARYGGFLRADLLKVPHHGSGGGAEEPLLERCRAQIAAISVGRRNRFGHPARDLLERLTRQNIRVWRTDRQGALVVSTDGEDLETAEWADPPLL